MISSHHQNYDTIIQNLQNAVAALQNGQTAPSPGESSLTERIASAETNYQAAELRLNQKINDLIN